MDRVIDKLLEFDARFVEVWVQRYSGSNILLKDGKAKDVSTGKGLGVGVRVLENIWGFCSSNRVEDIPEMAERALKVAGKGSKKVALAEVPIYIDRVEVKGRLDPRKLSLEEKRDLLKRCHAGIEERKEVVSSSFSYFESVVETHYANSEGAKIVSTCPRVALSASVFAKRGAALQFGSERVGGTAGIEAIGEPEAVAGCAAEKAERLLGAGAAPGGEFKVILDPKLTGVFIHEALGHAAEADHVLQGESILTGRLGGEVAADCVSVYDDPTLEGSFGFYRYDSEGVKAKKRALIEEGVLKSYLHSRETAAELGGEPGNARAQNYSHQPIVRMSNTYVGRGGCELEEMLAEVKEGVYLRGSRGGEVDPARGVFQFSAEEGFLIEGGELTSCIRDVSLSGETLEILKKVTSVGSGFDTSVGFCGKGSQSVPVGDGGPHLATTATVGGTDS